MVKQITNVAICTFVTKAIDFSTDIKSHAFVLPIIWSCVRQIDRQHRLG
jgi:hypothetical protein